jgi:hypothetical protein
LSAEVFQISGTAFHSSEATPPSPSPLSESNELSNKGENFLIFVFSVCIVVKLCDLNFELEIKLDNDEMKQQEGNERWRKKGANLGLRLA